MAVSYPIEAALLFSTFRVRQLAFWLDDPMEVSRTAGGEIIPGSLGDALWRGTVQLGLHRHADQAAAEAALAMIARPGATFMMYDKRRYGPRQDPQGLILGATRPEIQQVGASNREIALKNLPAGYQITRGDYVGWQYGSNPVRHALHQFWGDGIASGAGVTPLIEVTSFVQPVPVNTPVTLVRPQIKAIVDAREYGVGQGSITEGSTFSFIQTLGR